MVTRASRLLTVASFAAHFGLGKEESCDLEVEWPHGKGKTVRTGVKVDRTLIVER